MKIAAAKISTIPGFSTDTDKNPAQYCAFCVIKFDKDDIKLSDKVHTIMIYFKQFKHLHEPSLI